MSEVTKPIALDESLNTTESTPRNIADVLADETGDLVTQATAIVTKLQALINAVKPNASDIPLDPITGMRANNVQDGVSELKGTFALYALIANTLYKYDTTITTIPSDSYIPSLDLGMYKVALASASSYIPSQYCNLIIFKASNYGVAMTFTTSGDIYYRMFNADTKNYYHVWKRITAT